MILEPIPANAGLYFAKENFLESLREECTREGALLIFDEVMTGFRVARGGAQELYNITPDLTALGKVIGGGLPVGAFGGRAEIMDQLSPEGPVYQAGTLSGNPLAMAAGLAQLRELQRIDGWSLLEQLGSQLEEATRSTLRALDLPLTFQRVGSMFCLYFTAAPVIDLASAKTEQSRRVRAVFRTVSGRRRLLCAFAVRSRISFDRPHIRRCGTDGGSRAPRALLAGPPVATWAEFLQKSVCDAPYLV